MEFPQQTLRKPLRCIKELQSIQVDTTKVHTPTKSRNILYKKNKALLGKCNETFLNLGTLPNRGFLIKCKVIDIESSAQIDKYGLEILVEVFLQMK